MYHDKFWYEFLTNKRKILKEQKMVPPLFTCVTFNQNRPWILAKWKLRQNPVFATWSLWFHKIETFMSLPICTNSGNICHGKKQKTIITLNRNLNDFLTLPWHMILCYLSGSAQTYTFSYVIDWWKIVTQKIGYRIPVSMQIWQQCSSNC